MCRNWELNLRVQSCDQEGREWEPQSWNTQQTLSKNASKTKTNVSLDVTLLPQSCGVCMKVGGFYLRGYPCATTSWTSEMNQEGGGERERNFFSPSPENDSKQHPIMQKPFGVKIILGGGVLQHRQTDMNIVVTLGHVLRERTGRHKEMPLCVDARGERNKVASEERRQ